MLEAANHPVAIVTKSALVTRDIDILSRMAAKGLAKVALSVTTLDRRMARAMEPRASTPSLRLKAISDLARGRHSGFGDGGAGDPRRSTTTRSNAFSIRPAERVRARQVS